MLLESGQVTKGEHEDAPGFGMDEGPWDIIGPADGMAELATEGRWSRTNKSYSNEGSSSGDGSSLGDELWEEAGRGESTPTTAFSIVRWTCLPFVSSSTGAIVYTEPPSLGILNTRYFTELHRSRVFWGPLALKSRKYTNCPSCSGKSLTC